MLAILHPTPRDNNYLFIFREWKIYQIINIIFTNVTKGLRTWLVVSVTWKWVKLQIHKKCNKVTK